MPSHPPSPRLTGRWRFGVFDFDEQTLELRKAGRLVAVRPQPLRLLSLLVRHPGQLVTRDDVQRALWDADTFVDFEQGVNQAVRELRAALGDDADSPRFIETLPRRGYRFIAAVEVVSPMAGAAAPLSLPAPAEAAATEEPEGAAVGTSWLARHPLLARGLLAGTVTIVAITAASRLASRPEVPATSAVATEMLAIRPFAVAGANPAAGLGLATAIAARLGGQRLVAITRLSGQADPAPATSLVLEGDLSSSANRVVVVVRLIQAHSGRLAWSDTIRVRSDALYNVEAVVAERVVGALRLQLAASEQDRLLRRYTRNAAAYDAYLTGRAELVKYTPESTLAAINAFEAALRMDSGYALARAGLAMACADQDLRFAPAGDVERWAERAESEARAALALDPNLAEGHLARATVARKREFDWITALEASRRALVLNPNLSQAHLIIAAAYYHLGYMEEARLALDHGRRGDDVVEPARIDGLLALFSGRFAPAVAHLEEVSRQSSQAIGDTYLALAYYYGGKIERGQAMLEQLAGHRSASTAARAGAALAAVLAAQGDAGGARVRLQQVLAADYRDHHVAYGIGAAYAQLGDPANALRWLRIAADTGFPCRSWFEADPFLAPLRRLPSYGDLLAHVDTQRAAGRPDGRQ